tara:strand:+ start:1713 stop:1967 length:255 start_codon:yes stop_codon:yes gene_type:complete
LFANIPPTFAAAFIKISGLTSSIVFFVSSNENKLVSSLLDSITSVIISEFLNFLATDEPTSPLLPKIKALIFHLIKFYSKKIIT